MQAGGVLKSAEAPMKKSAKAEEADAIRAAQEQLAQQNAPKFQLVPEPTTAPMQPDVAVPDVATSATPSASPLELAVHALLDQMQAAVAPSTPIAKPAAGEAPIVAPPVPEVVDELVGLMTQVAPEAAAIKDLVATFTEDETADEEIGDKKTDTLPEGLPFADTMTRPEPTVAPSKGPTAVVAVRDPAPLPENANPSHVHLVMDHDGERMVVTVAVRGTEVTATLRGGDEQTAAAVARNAATLDHALRARGLDLTNFTAERELGHDRRQHEAPEREDNEETAVFRMEEK